MPDPQALPPPPAGYTISSDPANLPPPPAGYTIATQPNQPPTTREQLKDQGFWDSAWQSIKAPFAIIGNALSGGYAKDKQAEFDEYKKLSEDGTPEQKRDFAKDYLLRNIPGLSTAYKAWQGNLGGAAGDVAGIAALGAVAKTAPKVADAAASTFKIATNPEVVRAGVAVLPKGQAMLKLADAIKAARKPLTPPPSPPPPQGWTGNLPEPPALPPEPVPIPPNANTSMPPGWTGTGTILEPAPPPTPRSAPPWAGNPAPVTPAPESAVEPIPSDLSSGRSVPSPEERIARANTPADSESKILDDIAQGMGGKSYATMTPQDQAIVRQVAERMKQPPAPPRQPGPPARIDIGKPVPPGKPLSQQIDEDLAREKAAPPVAEQPLPAVEAPAATASPAAPPEVEAPAEPAPAAEVTPGKTVIFIGDKPAVLKSPKAAEIAGQLANEVNPRAPDKIIAASRSAKAARFVEALQKYGIDAESAGQIEPGYVSQAQIQQGVAPRWGNIAEFIGEKEPSAATLKEISRQMRGKAVPTVPENTANIPQEVPSGSKIEGNAEQVDSGTTRPVDSGATGEGGADHGVGPSGARRVSGEKTDVLIPGEDIALPARYQIRELAEIQPSHNGQTFSPNEAYALKNERNYSAPENQQRVIENSSEERFNPRYHITDNPDATNGPILIDEDGNAVGGNSRAMILQRVYGRNAQGAQAYRSLLENRAQQFGIDPAALQGMKQPVLVRALRQDELDALPGGSKWAIRKTNVTGTAQLSAAERAAADAGQLSPELLEHVGSVIEKAGPDATLNDALTGKSGTALVNKLIADGFFSEQERPALMDGKTGALTQAAKDRISKALVGQFFRDSDQIARTPASIKAKLERIAAPLSKVQGNPQWTLTPGFQQAIDLLEYADAHGIKNLKDVVAQDDLFGGAPQWSSESVKLAEWLRDSKPNDLVGAVRKYVNDREPTMFGEATPEESFAQHFGGVKTPWTEPPRTAREKIAAGQKRAPQRFTEEEVRRRAMEQGYDPDLTLKLARSKGLVDDGRP